MTNEEKEKLYIKKKEEEFAKQICKGRAECISELIAEYIAKDYVDMIAEEREKMIRQIRLQGVSEEVINKIISEMLKEAA